MLGEVAACRCFATRRERVPKCRVCRPARVPLDVVKKSRPPRGWCAAPPPRLTAPEGLWRWVRGGSGRLRALRVGGSGRPPGGLPLELACPRKGVLSSQLALRACRLRRCVVLCDVGWSVGREREREKLPCLALVWVGELEFCGADPAWAQ